MEEQGLILVTGGAGFIGSHLVKALGGRNVTVIDNFHSGSPDNLKEFNGLVVKGDVKDLGTMHFKPDVIFHLGMYSSSPMYLHDHKLVSEVVAGATAVFDLAAACNSRVVYASTSSLYFGNSPPFKESMTPDFPSDFYTEARIAVERLAELYRVRFGVQSLGLRFFSVYGPGEESKGQYANMITQFVWAAKDRAQQLMGKKPTIYGDGSIERDFVHVDDAVRALKLAMTKGSELGVVNVGTGTAHSFNEILDWVSEWTGVNVRSKVEFIPMPRNYLLKQLADTVRAEGEFGFKAQVDVEKGLREMVR